MKARLVPVYFQSGRDRDFDHQVNVLRNELVDHAEFNPIELGAQLPEADAVVFPQLLGDAYRQKEAIRAIRLPMMIITSEFGTLSMWDWEIRSYLRSEGIQTIAPYTIDQTKKICRGLGVKRALPSVKFVVYQDNPGQGFQADIFKRFYWWEEECTRRMVKKFGLQIEKRSFKKLGEEAKNIPVGEAQAVFQDWKSRLNIGQISEEALHNALNIYIVLRREMAEDESIQAIGINCLNELHFSNTTPCLAWNMLFEDQRLIWGCEADTVSMLTSYILQKSLDVPIMMTNLYPFLLGQAALKHERISAFPDLPDPEDHLLVAHCGYLGVLPQSFATEWTLRKKVLAIVDENASAIDARLPVGEITLAKFYPTFEKMMVAEGSLEGYAQYPGSDCLNGAVLRIPGGRRWMDQLISHHYMLMTGRNRPEIDLIANIFNFETENL